MERVVREAPPGMVYVGTGHRGAVGRRGAWRDRGYQIGGVRRDTLNSPGTKQTKGERNRRKRKEKKNLLLWDQLGGRERSLVGMRAHRREQPSGRYHVWGWTPRS
jgi:hypothetical protein